MTNVSGMRWCNLWPLFTEYFGCRPGVLVPMKLADFMADKGPVWDEIARKHQLKPMDFSDLGDWGFADWNFGRTWDTILEDTKRLQYGFTEAIDTEQNFLEDLRRHARRTGNPGGLRKTSRGAHSHLPLSPAALPGRRPGRRDCAARVARSQASGASARRLREMNKSRAGNDPAWVSS